MKILIISHAYAERDNHKKLEAIAERVSLSVVYPRRWRTWHKEEKISGGLTEPSRYQEYPLDVFFSGDGGRYFYNPLQLIISIIRFRPDLIHLEEEPWTPVALEVLLLASLFRRRLVFFTWENIDLDLSFWQKAIEKRVLGYAHSALAGSRDAIDRLKNQRFTKKIILLPQFGVDPMLFYPQEKDRLRRKYGFAENVFLIGYAGRLVPEKGLLSLIEAFGQARIKGKSLSLVTSSDYCEEKIAAKLREFPDQSQLRVFFSTPHYLFPDYFNLFDVLVLPSLTTPRWKEQFGRVLIEAMACRVAVVGSSSGAIRDVIEAGGEIFKEGDAGELVAILEDLSQNREERLLLARAGYRRVLENYTFEKVAAETVAFYQSL